jgi:hypothetical protein
MTGKYNITFEIESIQSLEFAIAELEGRVEGLKARGEAERFKLRGQALQRKFNDAMHYLTALNMTPERHHRLTINIYGQLLIVESGGVAELAKKISDASTPPAGFENFRPYETWDRISDKTGGILSQFWYSGKRGISAEDFANKVEDLQRYL